MDPLALKAAIRKLTIVDVDDEIKRAEKMHGQLPIADLCRVSAILTEECGEVAEASLEVGRGTGSLKHLQKEYIHVATVALRAAGMLQPQVDEEQEKADVQA
jgi:hypothetical protein